MITGACGFVGRNLVRSLLADHEELWLIDDLSTGTHPDTWLAEMLPGAEGSGERPREYTVGTQKVRFFEIDVDARVMIPPLARRTPRPRTGATEAGTAAVGER